MHFKKRFVFLVIVFFSIAFLILLKQGFSLTSTNTLLFNTSTNKFFYPISDSAWNIKNLYDKDNELLLNYLDKRKEQGFNTIKFHISWNNSQEITTEAWEFYDTLIKELRKRNMYAEIGVSNLETAKKSLERWQENENIFSFIAFETNFTSKSDLILIAQEIKKNNPKTQVSIYSLKNISEFENYIDYYYIQSENPNKDINEYIKKNKKPVYQGSLLKNQKDLFYIAYLKNVSGITYSNDFIYNFIKNNTDSWILELDSPEIQKITEIAKQINPCEDNDLDGSFSQPYCGTKQDCNDNNKDINPDSKEICENNIDENCDGFDLSCLNISCFDVESRITQGYLCEEGLVCPGKSTKSIETGHSDNLNGGLQDVCCSVPCVKPKIITCQECGIGFFNQCDKKECYSAFGEKCYFSITPEFLFLKYKECGSCNNLLSCFDYLQKDLCEEDPCSMNCKWESGICINKNEMAFQ